MSDLYKKYFETGDVYDGLGKLMYAVKESNISDSDLEIISNELVQRGEIPEHSNFEEKPWWKWNRRYVSFLMNGMSTGRVSKDYLIYFFKVRRGVKIRNVAIACTVVVAIVIAIVIVITNHSEKRATDSNSTLMSSGVESIPIKYTDIVVPHEGNNSALLLSTENVAV